MELLSASGSFASIFSAVGGEKFFTNSDKFPGSTAEVFGVNLLGGSDTAVFPPTSLFADSELVCPFAPASETNKSIKFVEEFPMFAINGVDLFEGPTIGINSEVGKYLYF